MSTELKSIQGKIEIPTTVLLSEYKDAEIHLTRFYGGKERGTSLQLGFINETNDYCHVQLAREQVIELIAILKDEFEPQSIHIIISEEKCYKIVQKLYAIYTWSMIFPFMNVKLRTHDGFCIAMLKFIRDEYGYPMQCYNDEVLEFIKKYSNFETRELYWFRKGRIRPRRKLLKLAIKNYKLSSKIQ